MATPDQNPINQGLEDEKAREKREFLEFFHNLSADHVKAVFLDITFMPSHVGMSIAHVLSGSHRVHTLAAFKMGFQELLDKGAAVVVGKPEIKSAEELSYEDSVALTAEMRNNFFKYFPKFEGSLNEEISK